MLFLGAYAFANIYTYNPWAANDHEELELVRQHAVMVTGPDKPENDEYHNMYPEQRRNAKIKALFLQSNLARLLIPSYADYTPKTPESLAKPKLPHRFEEHTYE